MTDVLPTPSSLRRSRDDSSKHAAAPGRRTVAVASLPKREAMKTLNVGVDYSKRSENKMHNVG